MQECLRLWEKTHRNQKRIEQIELPLRGQLWWFNYQKEIQMEKALRILTDEDLMVQNTIWFEQRRDALAKVLAIGAPTEADADRWLEQAEGY
jgi:hypothetical protein